MKFPYRLGFIGFGNMANAILSGILRDKLLLSTEIGVFDADEKKCADAEAFGLKVFTSNAELAGSCEYVLFAVKPQCSESILREINLTENTIISIMAGIRLEKLVESSGCPRVARCMPNTPCMVGKGAIAVDASRLSDEQKAFVLSVLSSTGNVVELPDSQMDAVTAVSGSGPAYVYLFMQGMIEEGIRLGLTYEQAKTLTTATFEGAARLCQTSERDLDSLIDSVCSKGGTTIQAVDSFRQDEISEIISRAMKKCYDRSVELGK